MISNVNYFRRITVEYVILGLLLIRPMTVYDINGAFKKGISLFFSASYGSIQSALKKLLQTGKITCEESVESGRHKKTYSITEKGSNEFFAWIESPIPENKLEVNILSKIYFLGLVRSSKVKTAILRDIRDRIDLSLKELSRLGIEEKQKARNDRQMQISKYQMKILDYGVMSMNSAREWIEDMIGEEKRVNKIN